MLGSEQPLSNGERIVSFLSKGVPCLSMGRKRRENGGEVSMSEIYSDRVPVIRNLSLSLQVDFAETRSAGINGSVA